MSNYPKRRAPEPGPLFESRPPAQAHSTTSIAAAEEIREGAATLRARVLDFLRSRGAEGATDEEIVEATGMNPSTARPRRVELVEAGLVMNSGRRRNTAAGRAAVVWAVISADDAAAILARFGGKEGGER